MQCYKRLKDLCLRNLGPAHLRTREAIQLLHRSTGRWEALGFACAVPRMRPPVVNEAYSDSGDVLLDDSGRRSPPPANVLRAYSIPNASAQEETA
jgi:hypothetical protein